MEYMPHIQIVKSMAHTSEKEIPSISKPLILSLTRTFPLAMTVRRAHLNFYQPIHRYIHKHTLELVNAQEFHKTHSRFNEFRTTQLQ